MSPPPGGIKKLKYQVAIDYHKKEDVGQGNIYLVCTTGVADRR